MALFEITQTELRPVPETTFAASNIKERADLQRLLRTQIDIVSPDTLVIAEEFGEWDGSNRRIDLLGLDRDAWEARIRELAERGDAAWHAQDEVAWRRCYNEAQALRETAIQQEFATQDLNDPAHLGRQQITLTFVAQRLANDLEDFVPSSDPDVRGRQLGERDRLMGSVSQMLKQLEAVDSSQAQVARQRLDQISHELDRAYAATERLPQLGLVTERGT